MIKMHDGTVIRGSQVEDKIKELEEEQEQEMQMIEKRAQQAREQRELAYAEALEKAGQLDESGMFWLNVFPCLRKFLEEEEDDDDDDEILDERESQIDDLKVYGGVVKK